MEQYYISGQLDVRNQPEGVIMGKTVVSISFTAVAANAPPQYTGPSAINDLVVSVGRQLQGFDADGDQFTWSFKDPAAASGKMTLTSGGLATALVPLANQAYEIVLDDGKP